MSSFPRLFMFGDSENKLTRVDEKIKGLYKIIASGTKQVDQDSWTLDQEISWAGLNEYLGLNVVPGELIPHETCMKIVGEFTTLGLDCDVIPKEGLDLMGLLSSIYVHIAPVHRRLTVKNEYSFSSFETLRNSDQKHHFVKPDIKGVNLKSGKVEKPDHNGCAHVGLSDQQHEHKNGNCVYVTDLENVDINDLWAGDTTTSIKDRLINKEDLMNVNVEDAYPKGGSMELPDDLKLHMEARRDDKDNLNPKVMTTAERRAFNHSQYQLAGSMGSDRYCFVGEVPNYERIPDIHPEVVYTEEQEAAFKGYPWLSPAEATAASVLVKLEGKLLHPRHWRYAAGNEIVVFLNKDIDIDKIEISTVDHTHLYSLRFLPKLMRVGLVGSPGLPAYLLSSEIMSNLHAAVVAGEIKIKIINPVQRSNVDWNNHIENKLLRNPNILVVGGSGFTERYFEELEDKVGGVTHVYRNALLNSHFRSGNFEQEQTPNEPTVKGNGRQKLIDNGKRTWPAARTKKGKR